MLRILISLVITTSLIFPRGYICAVGGGAEEIGGWSDVAYQWIVNKANKGKIVILSISDTDTWLVNYFKSFGASEVINLNISNKTQANDNNNYNIVNSANGIFIKGGDQYDYISYWKGTLLETAIKNVYKKGGVIAGTSAGAMILGEYYFTARYGSVYPDECIANPFNYYANIDKNFLNLASNTLFDTHVSERGRILRLVPFVFQVLVNKNVKILGVGIDDKTALCIDTNLVGEVYGSGAVHFVHFDNLSNYTLNSSNKYTIKDVKVDMLTQGWSYDLVNKVVVEIPNSAASVNLTQNNIIVKANCLITGSNDLKQNVKAIEMFLQNNFTKIAILYNTGSIIDYIKNYFNERTIHYEAIEVKSSTLNDVSATNKLSTCDGVILYGSTLSVIYALADTNYLLSKELFKKFNPNKLNLLFLGNTCKMIAKSYYDNYDNSATASLYGKMTNKKGLNIIENLSFVPRIFESRDYYENRVNALLYALMHNRDILGAYLDTNYIFKIDKKGIYSYNNKPLIIVDTKNVGYLDSSKHMFSSSTSPRQVIAATNLRFNISTQESDFIFQNHVIGIENRGEKNTDDFIVYPNPFNPVAKLKFNCSVDDFYMINLYDINGKKVKEIYNGKLNRGVQEIDIEMNNYSAGIYIVKIKNFVFQKSINIIYQK